MNQAFSSFSVIIPTYRRPEELRVCLGALARLDYPHNCFEVIVVNDGGEVPLEDIIAPFCDQLDVTLLTQTHAGPAAARNIGAARAKGECLVFTDDDCAPASNWLQSLAARFSKSSNCVIGGRTLNAVCNNIYSTASQLLVNYLHTYYNADPNRARFLTSNNLAIPADCFHSIGGFDKTFLRAAGEDRELCDRLLYYGYRLIYASEVVVNHAHALTLHSFWRQHLSYGRGAFRLRQVHTRRGRMHINLEPPSFYLNLLRYPFSQVRGWRALLIVFLIVISQIANATGFLSERINQNRNT